MGLLPHTLCKAAFALACINEPRSVVCLLITNVALTIVEIAAVMTGDGDSSDRHHRSDESKERSRIGKRARHQPKRIARKLR